MNKVLVIIDMQNDFIDGALAAEGGKSIVHDVVQQILGFQGKVYYTLDTHGDNYLQTQEGSNLPVIHCQKGEEGHNMPREIQRALEEKRAKKFEKPSFGSSELVLELVEENKRQPIEEILLMGICTDICVLTNAISLKCFLPEVPIVVKGSYSAGVTQERHETALRAMEFCQIKIIE